jgi:hypothetical protein
VQSHLPNGNGFAACSVFCKLLSKEGREKWMDKLRSERQPLIHGFTDFHDMIFFMTSTLVSMTGAGKLPSHLQRSARRIATVMIRSMT